MLSEERAASWRGLRRCGMASVGLDAADEELDRLEDAGLVIEEILAIDDTIPQELLDKAECVIPLHVAAARR
jgi:hypothetical protein